MAKEMKKAANASEEKIENITEETVEEVVEAPKATKTRKTSRKFEPDLLISCRSITFGELLMEGPKTKLLYTWSNYGDVTEVEYQDLQALKSTKSSYIFRPRFIIEDEEICDEWERDLESLYQSVIDVDVEEMFKLPLNQFKSRLKKAPKGVQQAIKNIAGEGIMNGSLDSIKKINAIDEILGTDLKLYIK